MALILGAVSSSWYLAFALRVEDLVLALGPMALILGAVSSSWYLAFALRVEDLALALGPMALSWAQYLLHGTWPLP